MNDEIKEILQKIENVANRETASRNDLMEMKDTDYQLLLDYITNLQQENEKLKQPQVFIDTQDMEERYGEELYKDYLKEQLKNYKSRIDKAISILNKRKEDVENFSWVEMRRNSYYEECDEVINILKGDSNENV